MSMTYEYLVEEYVNKQRSTHEIAEELGTYPNRVRRALNKFGIPVRSRSEAQLVALEQGRQEHPTRGKKLSPERKVQIGERMAEQWGSMSDEERKRRSEISKKQWETMDEGRRESLQKKALDAVRVAADTGSRLEKYLIRGLTQAKYPVDFHVQLDRQHIDMVVGRKVGQFKGMAVEVNGPSHYKPIWGDDYYEKRAASDVKKVGMLVGSNFLVIIIKDTKGSPSEIRMRTTLQKLLSIIELAKTDPGVGSYHEIEVGVDG